MKKLFLFFFIGFSCLGQNEQTFGEYALRPELFFGKTIAAFELYPNTNSQFIIGMSFEKKNLFPEKQWESILNFPTTGVSVYFTNYGNKDLLGRSVSVLPFIKLNLNKKQNFHFKGGLGISYFDTRYDVVNNPRNSAISTKLTWAFQTFLYYNLLSKNNKDLQLGIGYIHHSNGHAQLPNEGLNSALMSISTKIDVKKSIIKNDTKFDLNNVKTFSKGFYSIRYGQGIHKFVKNESLVKAINSIEVYGGLFYKDIFKVSLGATYRFYHHYYDYINENELEPYYSKPILNASNLYLSVGVEAMLGHIGIDWEGGLNLHKPFYKEQYLLEEPELDFFYDLKKLFLGRLGLKLYAINTSKMPKNNFYLSAHINSNLSQADFSELSLGFTHRIFTK
ncbi:acyloxyacyl hydrolase [Lutibacter flavus]|uniref:Lipid A 3-O-deacylase (PagL) n=1 Tax=Lutibacter flavus TaxID=691689 RepID=A0A238VHF4_9FLAO|nr:acyloxyacyl hydrolase [Lutibacter flavus]SNR33618.1 Lipid A 3-O-deacylase (PagL) [Lutibacter flavus]